jgi:hypothetical protein
VAKKTKIVTHNLETVNTQENSSTMLYEWRARRELNPRPTDFFAVLRLKSPLLCLAELRAHILLLNKFSLRNIELAVSIKLGTSKWRLIVLLEIAISPAQLSSFFKKNHYKLAPATNVSTEIE